MPGARVGIFEILRSMCLHLHQQAGQARAFSDSESSPVNAELKETHFKSLRTLITLLFFLFCINESFGKCSKGDSDLRDVSWQEKSLLWSLPVSLPTDAEHLLGLHLPWVCVCPLERDPVGSSVWKPFVDKGHSLPSSSCET